MADGEETQSDSFDVSCSNKTHLADAASMKDPTEDVSEQLTMIEGTLSEDSVR